MSINVLIKDNAMDAIIGQTGVTASIGVQQIGVGADRWWHHPEWVDVSNVADNEINLLVGDFGIAVVAFDVGVANSGTFYVDWGDGVQESFTNYAIAQHKYTVGSGKPCSLGYSTYKIRIWSTDTIVRFYVTSPTGYIPYASNYNAPILEAYLGTTGLTTLQNTFSKVYPLVAIILPTSLPNCTSYSYMSQFCYNLKYIGAPANVNSNASLVQVFYYDYTLDNIELTNIKLGNRVFCNAGNLKRVSFTNCTLDSDSSYLFYSAPNLKEVTLPNGQDVTNASYMFGSSGVEQINNLENLGSRTVDVNFTAFSAGGGGAPIPQHKEYHIYARISKIDIKGYDANNKNGAEVIRLYNAASSGFGGTAPQIDVSYTKLSAEALNALFNDLPIMSGKEIKITGADGAATCDTSIATNKGWTVIN